MDSRFLRITRIFTSAVLLTLLALPAGATQLGKGKPAAPTDFLDLSEEAFGEAMGIQPEPPKPPALPATAPGASLLPANGAAPLSALPPPNAATGLLPPSQPLLPGQNPGPTVPGADATNSPTVATAQSAPPTAPGTVPLAEGEKATSSPAAPGLIPPLSAEAAATLQSTPETPVAETKSVEAPADTPVAAAALSAFPDVFRERVVPITTPMPALPGVADVAIILANGQFFPSRVRLKGGLETRLLFTSVQTKPAALVIERLDIQKWVRPENTSEFKSELERARFEINREIASNRITEIVLDPKSGTYVFHDALSGASGELVVE